MGSSQSLRPSVWAVTGLVALPLTPPRSRGARPEASAAPSQPRNVSARAAKRSVRDIAMDGTGHGTYFGALVSFVKGSLLTWALCLGLNKTAVVYMASLYVGGLAYMVKSKDNADLKSVSDPETAFLQSSSKVHRKTLIFIRHGESMWNETFNGSKMPLYFFARVVKAFMYEMYLLGTGCDSWFYDSPLNVDGQQQCVGLAEFIAKERGEGLEETLKKHLQVLDGTSQQSSVLVSSNLRRAMSTSLIALRQRLGNTEEKVVVLPSLQEISRNIDTQSITAPMTVPNPAWLEQTSTVIDFNRGYNQGFDVSQNTGNKTLEVNGLSRLRAFAKWTFSQPADCVVVAGHSLWFQSFFSVFLPHKRRTGILKDATTRKIVNAGAVAVDIVMKGAGDDAFYMLDPKTLRVIYGGFK